MKKYQFGHWFSVFSQLLFSCSAVFAGPATSSYHWEGFYAGATAGGVFSRFDAKTSTQAGPMLDIAQADAVNHAGNQNIHTKGFLTGIEGGYNWQFNQGLFGIEGDLQALSTNGETNSNAIVYPNRPDRQFVITTYGNNNWLFTLRPRFGWVAADNWLFYITGGLGLTPLQSDFIFSNNVGEFESKRVSKLIPGYVIGAGIETVLTNHISLKAEYLFASFRNTKASNMNNNIPAGQIFSNRGNLNSNIFRMGLNYHFIDQPELLDTSLWQTEIGVRLFLSSGLDGAPQPLLNTSNTGDQVASRLTFSDLAAVSQETFARLTHSSGLFAKGCLGAGSVTSGQLNDEDFPAGGAYSNTLSNVKGNLSYATLDLGFSFLKSSSGSAGAFIGYNYYAENLNVYNCKQLAGAEVCEDSNEFSKFLGISQDDRINSLRVGLSSQFALTNQLTLTTEAAYLPAVNFNGQDIHNARQLIGPEHASSGDGAMLESTLDYQLNDSWSIGVGGRYWMWNTHNGSVVFDFLGESETISEPARFKAERYGAFLQLNYHNKKMNNSIDWSTPVNWKGIFIGGNLGGAWGKNRWSDPFGTSVVPTGRMNIAGFGDQIKSTGPLIGTNLHLNWQTVQWVYGITTGINFADIRGQNTLFSGLGGINGQTITNYIGTIIARFGIAFNRSVFYVNGGRAILHTKYKINGNTGILTLGSAIKTMSNWGWTSGIGIEYAFDDHWTSNVEYNYIRIPCHNISFPSVELINQYQIPSNQTMNIFTLGLNYKFKKFA